MCTHCHRFWRDALGVAWSKRGLEVDDPECREIAEQLLREVRKIVRDVPELRPPWIDSRGSGLFSRSAALRGVHRQSRTTRRRCQPTRDVSPGPSRARAPDRRSYVLSRGRRRGAGRPVMGHSRGHALIRPCGSAWVTVTGRQVARRTTREGVRAILGQSRHRDPICFVASARKLLEDLAGDVALEGPDDLGFGATFGEAALHVGDGARFALA